MTTHRPAAHSVGARHAVPVFSPMPTPTVNLTPANATLPKTPVNAGNKGLTKALNPLDTMFTKYRGAPLES